MDAGRAIDHRRALQAWFATPLGRLVADAERSAVRDQLGRQDGVYLLQVGGYGHDVDLPLPCAVRHWVVDCDPSPGLALCGSADELPLCDDSVNAVVLVHALEFAHSPHSILREAVRVLAPEGKLLIIGFNPASLWGVSRVVRGLWHSRGPWGGHYYSIRRLRDWCSLLDLESLEARTLFFRPPIQRPGMQQRLEKVEHLAGRWLPWFGGVSMLVARKRVTKIIPLGKMPLRSRKFIPGSLVSGSTSTNANARSALANYREDAQTDNVRRQEKSRRK